MRKIVGCLLLTCTALAAGCEHTTAPEPPMPVYPRVAPRTAPVPIAGLRACPRPYTLYANETWRDRACNTSDADGKFSHAWSTAHHIHAMGVSLGQVGYHAWITPAHLGHFPGSDQGLNAARLLLTLDDDGNASNGIQLPDSLATARSDTLASSIPTQVSTLSFESNDSLHAFLALLTPRTTAGPRTLVGADSAQAWLERNRGPRLDEAIAGGALALIVRVDSLGVAPIGHLGLLEDYRAHWTPPSALLGPGGQEVALRWGTIGNSLFAWSSGSSDLPFRQITFDPGSQASDGFEGLLSTVVEGSFRQEPAWLFPARAWTFEELTGHWVLEGPGLPGEIQFVFRRDYSGSRTGPGEEQLEFYFNFDERGGMVTYPPDAGTPREYLYLFANRDPERWATYGYTGPQGEEQYDFVVMRRP